MLGDVSVGLVGEHQAENVGAAVAAVVQLRQQGWQLPDAAVVQGLQEAWLPGRFQVGGGSLWLMLAARTVGVLRLLG